MHTPQVSTRTARRNEALREMFSAYGEVADCYMPRNHATGQSRGFGFVRYREEAEAEAAMKGCDGVVIDGSAPLHLASAPPAPLHLCTSASLPSPGATCASRSPSTRAVCHSRLEPLSLAD